MDEQIRADEAKNGVRFSWNVFPDSRLEAARMAVPVGVLYSPLQKNEHGPVRAEYPPVRCKKETCRAVLNPYCRVDFISKVWACPFCMSRNHMPHAYSDISAENPPAELLGQYTTIEYLIENTQRAPVFLFVIDTCVIAEELEQVKNTIQQALQLVPEDALVGVVTFGRNVHVHELAFEECPKSYVFRGAKEVDTARVAQLLGLGAQHPEQSEARARQAARFIMPLSECELQVGQVLDDLRPDEWPVPNEMRPERATGTALAVAVGLLEATYRGANGRVLTFIGGPPTSGPGRVVDPELKTPIRSHHDLVSGDAPHFNAAVTYYDGLATRAQRNGHVLDLYACALDQVGVAEMKVCCDKTGGTMVLDDSFHSPVFTQSLQKAFDREDGTDDLAQGYSGQLQVLTSRDFTVSGAIGVAGSAEQKSASVSSEESVGVGGTNAWFLGGVGPSTTVALYFDMAQAQQQAPQTDQNRQGYLQLVTTYRHSSGRAVMRVTTVAKLLADPRTEQGLAYVRAGFDQEAAAVLVTRLATYKMENEFATDILRWLDRQLIRLTQKFAQYQPGQPDSFRLSDEFSYYPQFMFHLRRSQFLQVFNSSPDETAFFRSVMIRENVNNTLVMIQPTLMAYSLKGPPEPVLLDVSSVQAERILLLDTFFNVVLFHGDTINKWVKNNVHENPEYAYFAEFLRAAESDATELMATRNPYPRYVFCVEGGSQSRFLMAKLNPSITQNNHDIAQGNQPFVLTDDVSLKVFMEHLRRLAVSS